MKCFGKLGTHPASSLALSAWIRRKPDLHVDDYAGRWTCCSRGRRSRERWISVFHLCFFLNRTNSQYPFHSILSMRSQISQVENFSNAKSEQNFKHCRIGSIKPGTHTHSGTHTHTHIQRGQEQFRCLTCIRFILHHHYISPKLDST